MSLKDYTPKSLDFSGLPNIGHVDTSMLPSFAGPSTMLDVDDEFIRHLDHFSDQGDFLLDIDPTDGDELLAAVAQHASFKASPGLHNVRPRATGTAMDCSPRMKLAADGWAGLNALAPSLQARLAAGQFRLPTDLAQDAPCASNSEQALPCLGADAAATGHQRSGISNPQALLDSLYKLQQQQQQQADMETSAPPFTNPASAFPSLLAPRGAQASSQSSIWGAPSAGEAAALANVAAASASARLAAPTISITPPLAQLRTCTPWGTTTKVAAPQAANPRPATMLDALAPAVSAAAAPSAADISMDEQVAALRAVVASLPDTQLLEGLRQAGAGGAALGEALAAVLQGQLPEHLTAAYKSNGLASSLASLGQLPSMTLPQAPDLTAPPGLNLLPPTSSPHLLPPTLAPHPLPPTSVPHLIPPSAVTRQLTRAAAHQQQAADALLASLGTAHHPLDMAPGGGDDTTPTLTRPRAPAAKVRRFSASSGGSITTDEEQQQAAHTAAMAAAVSSADVMHAAWGDDSMMPAHVVLPSLSRLPSALMPPRQPDTPTLPLRAEQHAFGVGQAPENSGSGSDTSTKEAHGAPSPGDQGDAQEEEGGGRAARGEDEDEQGATSARAAAFAAAEAQLGPRREITRNALREVYNYPINEAAKLLGVGVTVLKNHCRKFEIPRWPYRKLKSMEKLIESVQDYASEDPEMTSTVLAELTSFRDMIYEDPAIDLEARIKKLRQANFKMEYKQRLRASAPDAPAPTAAAPARAAGKRGPSLRSAQCA